MKSTSNRDLDDELNKAEEALREIYMLCGYGDPSDGEGTSPKEVVEAVRDCLTKTNSAPARRLDWEFRVMVLRLLCDISRNTCHSSGGSFMLREKAHKLITDIESLGTKPDGRENE